MYGEASAATAPAVCVPLQLVFAYQYSAVPELDAFTELGSRDYTIRECTTRGAVILPVSDLMRPRRRVPVPDGQLRADWQARSQTASTSSSQRFPEYIWFQ